MFSRLFSGEEGFENTGEHIIRDTSAGIIDGQTNILSWSGSFRPVRLAIDNCIECSRVKMPPDCMASLALRAKFRMINSIWVGSTRAGQGLLPFPFGAVRSR